MQIKDYLGSENARNKKYARLYTDLIKRAFGPDQDVLIGHHITFEEHGNIETENEIPAADTLLFCHTVMRRVFGDALAYSLMQRMAVIPADSGEREALVLEALALIGEPAHG